MNAQNGEYGFGCIKALSQSFYGIEDVELFQTAGLNVDDADAEGIVKKCLSAMLE